MTSISKVALLVIDSLRYDCVGYQPDKKYLERDHVLGLLDTPNIDKIANESMCFTKCYSTSSLTPQVLASMFTGTRQIDHGIRYESDSSKIVLNKKTITIAEILKKLGYLTVFICDSPLHLTVHQITRGFDYNFSENDKGLFSFLQKNRNEKIFLYCNIEDVHVPYLHSLVPPNHGYNDDYFEIMRELYKRYKLPEQSSHWELWKNLFDVDQDRKLWLPLYVKGVSKFDKGRFKVIIDNLSKCGFMDKESLLIITSDHGEGKTLSNKPSHFNHGGDGYNEVSRVPLIVKTPEFKHEIREDLVSNIDVFRIILDLVIEDKAHNFINYKLECINPFYEKREYAWYVFSRRSFHDNPLEYHVGTRTIFTKEKKFILRGMPEFFLNRAFDNMTNEEFVDKLYDNLYARRAAKEEKEQHISKLNKGIFEKQQVYQNFLNANEYTKKMAFSVVDLKSDPFEEHPISPARDIKTLLEYTKYLQYMIDLEKSDEKLKETYLERDNIVNVKDEKSLEEELRVELKRMGYI